ncbi:MAG: apolipoprotein N-acyltransferase [Microbacteriaceae bacterium]|nr:apolipoprotein N-acyltransferase [Microbacteriaceae bacterium]
MAAAGGGFLLDCALPQLALWPLAPVAIVLIVASAWGARLPLAALTGAVAGAAFWLPHLLWSTLYLGPVPWLALSGAMIAWFALCSALIALTPRRVERCLLPLFAAAAARRARCGLFLSTPQTKTNHAQNPGPAPDSAESAPSCAGRKLSTVYIISAAQSFVVAGLWIARELLQISWPYGGFAWGRMAATQANSPLLQAVSWFGVAGLGLFLVFFSVLPFAVFMNLRALRSGTQTEPSGHQADQAKTQKTAPNTIKNRAQPAGQDASRFSFQKNKKPLCVAAGISLAGFALLALLPAFPLQKTGQLRVAGVQGNAMAGIFHDRENGSVFQAHLAETEKMLDALEKRGQKTDLIVWPENSAEYDLAGNYNRRALIAAAAKRAGAPVLAGSVLPPEAPENPGDTRQTAYNSALAIGSQGEILARYDKLYPVPFAEYMPNRDFFHALVPDLVDLVRLDYLPGKRPAAVNLANSSLGLAICFDITFDRQTSQLMRENAAAIFVLSNNADFGTTDESAQQLALTKLQAVSAGRALVNVSTVGTSEIIAPDGSELASTPAHRPGFVYAEIPLISGHTPATIAGNWFAGAWIAVSAALLCGFFQVYRLFLK